jgi:hypothetical protein
VNGYILGITHSHQMRYRPLGAEVESIARANAVVLIAEEVNANLGDDKLKTISRDVANTMGIEWLPVGMKTDQEKTHGIYEDLEKARDVQVQGVNAFPKRANDVKENHWLDCIEAKYRGEGFTHGTVLIICGYNHRESIADKARSRGIVVVKVDWFPADLPSKVGPLVLLP